MLHGLLGLVIAAMSLYHQAQAVPAPTPTPVPVVESIREQPAPVDVGLREPVAEPSPPPAALPSGYYQPSLSDGTYTFCLTDAAGLGLGDAWVADNVSTYWGATGTVDCANPDLAIVVYDFGDTTYCGITTGWNIVELNSQCLTNDFTWLGNEMSGEYVGVAALLHEWGHFAGFNHTDPPSVMYAVTVYLPNDNDRAALAERYGWR
jgi:hypothetical protein